jgi:hypothetical protein
MLFIQQCKLVTRWRMFKKALLSHDFRPIDELYDLRFWAYQKDAYYQNIFLEDMTLKLVVVQIYLLYGNIQC